MSEIKVNKITPRTSCGTTQLGDSGDTFTVPAGATISNLGTATGFGGTGVVSWDTSSIKTTGFTAVTGTGYFCNTSGGAFTVTLPLSPSAGDVVGVSDYAQSFDTYALTLGRNSENIGGSAGDAIIGTEGIALTLVYVDATKGWIVTDSGLQSEAPEPKYIAATGGCITTCGDYKIHTFFSPGSLCVSCGGNPAGSSTVDYMVVAGGGSGGTRYGGGGGAGGFRESPGTASGCYTTSPRGAAPATAEPVTAQGYPIAIGGGGAGVSDGGNCSGNCGVNSSFSTITSTGGGRGAGQTPSPQAGDGGSGGGASYTAGGCHWGAGNTPPVSPAQGMNGGDGGPGGPTYASGGGGGAIAVGTTGSNVPSPAAPAQSGPGGDGAGTAINLSTMPAPSPVGAAQIGTSGPSPSVRYFAGGGGGGKTSSGAEQGSGGDGGGGGGGQTSCSTSVAGTINTGGGSGGGFGYPGNSAAGGSGIVVIRYKYQ